jgi:hypothetical protein
MISVISEFIEFRRGWYNPAMTLVEVMYELQSPLSDEQLRRLGEFANTYGLRRFRLDDSKKQLTFEYDASRLLETQVAHALGQARIAVARKANQQSQLTMLAVLVQNDW